MPVEVLTSPRLVEIHQLDPGCVKSLHRLVRHHLENQQLELGVFIALGADAEGIEDK